MHDHESSSPQRAGIRQGLAMLGGALALSPLLFVLERLLPSRENTSFDELPYMVFTGALVVLAVLGAARIGLALLMDSNAPQLRAPTTNKRLAERMDRVEARSEHARDHA